MRSALRVQTHVVVFCCFVFVFVCSAPCDCSDCATIANVKLSRDPIYVNANRLQIRIRREILHNPMWTDILGKFVSFVFYQNWKSSPERANTASTLEGLLERVPLRLDEPPGHLNAGELGSTS